MRHTLAFVGVWELKVIEMLQEGPEVAADGRTQIVEYLTRDLEF